MFFLQQTLWVFGEALAAALLVKLAYTGLIRVYPWFSAYLGVEIVRSVILLSIGPRTSSYTQVYIATQPLAWLLSISVVLELYSLALRNLPGIASLSRWVMSGSMAVAVGLSALSLAADLSRPVGSHKVLVYYSVIERGIVFSLVLFLVLITLFLVWSPISIRRNVVLHASVFSVHFVMVSFALFVRNLAGLQLTSMVSTVLVFVDCICFVIWVARLNRQGEETKVVVRRKWVAEDQEKLVRQMDALSESIRRTSR